ncbi:MAG TPA: hypothetical protein VGB38_06925 [bacterium]
MKKWFWVLLLLFFGCKKVFDPFSHKIPTSPIERFKTAADTVTVSGRQCYLQVYLYRDFMPIVPPGGNPLIAIINAIAEGPEAFPNNAVVDSLWIYSGDEVWVSILSEPGAGDPSKSNRITKVARNGPKWEPGTLADVFVRIVEDGKRIQFLRALKQPIQATF